ncbi:hypothetical protein POL25_21990 [Nannocystis sp. bb15-2]|uniref:Uncharacterized protein n=2 Tax=Nannocystis bainbridge TaxID=2995303 RepID=A0ABT5E2C7_9BACT|nr:hypothetical protein [Nannocystis bainbridge]
MSTIAKIAVRARNRPSGAAWRRFSRARVRRRSASARARTTAGRGAVIADARASPVPRDRPAPRVSIGDAVHGEDPGVTPACAKGQVKIGLRM